jgi:D-alanyl-D-alanine carboxypeptidase
MSCSVKLKKRLRNWALRKEVILHESENLVNIIKQIKQTNNNQRAQKLLEILYERDPVKYYDLMQKEGC